MSDFVVVVFASIAAGLLSLSVAIILLSSENLSSKLVKYGTPFAAGVLLMIGFRDLLPEGIAEEGVQVLNATLGAIVIFFLIENKITLFYFCCHKELHEYLKNISFVVCQYFYFLHEYLKVYFQTDVEPETVTRVSKTKNVVYFLM